MKNLRLFCFVLLAGLSFFIGVSTEALAEYYLGFYVQKRIYGDGREINRLCAWITDENNQQVMSASLVNDVTLYDPNGALVPLSNAGYWREEELYPWYNGDTGQWNYPDDWTTSMGYSAVIEDEIIPGTYTRLLPPTMVKRLQKSINSISL